MQSKFLEVLVINAKKDKEIKYPGLMVIAIVAFMYGSRMLGGTDPFDTRWMASALQCMISTALLYFIFEVNSSQLLKFAKEYKIEELSSRAGFSLGIIVVVSSILETLGLLMISFIPMNMSTFWWNIFFASLMFLLPMATIADSLEYEVAKIKRTNKQNKKKKVKGVPFFKLSKKEEVIDPSNRKSLIKVKPLRWKDGSSLKVCLNNLDYVGEKLSLFNIDNSPLLEVKYALEQTKDPSKHNTQLFKLLPTVNELISLAEKDVNNNDIKALTNKALTQMSEENSKKPDTTNQLKDIERYLESI